MDIKSFSKLKIILCLFFSVVLLCSVRSSSFNLPDDVVKLEKKSSEEENFSNDWFYRMPELYLFDNYEQCMGKYKREALYCFVNVFIKPDQTSKLYRYIEKYSKNTKHLFRRDKIQRGLCLNNVEKEIAVMGNSSEKYLVDKFPMNSKLIFDFIKYHEAEEHRLMYDDMVNKFVNIELMDSFNLSGYSTIEYCTNDAINVQKDWLDKTAGGVLAAILVLIIVSSAFDKIFFIGLDQDGKDSHYKILPRLKSHQILTMFSIKRNYFILIEPTKPNSLDLRPIDAFRVLTTFSVILGHCFMFLSFIPSLNPNILERNYSNPLATILTNGALIVQSFFFMSGFFISFTFYEHMKKEESSIRYFLKAIILRYIRITPLLASIILLHSTWLYRLSGGPLWNKIIFPERQFCRDNWWVNMLFLNNYLRTDQQCAIHTWYLAADYWLSALATVCLIIIYKKPYMKIGILGFVIGSAAVITASVTYYLKLEPVMINSPESLRNMFISANGTEPNYFTDQYIPTHMNIGNYFIGVAFGLFYRNCKMNSVDLSNKISIRVCWYLSIIAGFASIFVAYFFYEYDYQKPGLWISLLSIVIKHTWGVVSGIVLIGTIYNYGWFFPNIFNSPVWRIPSRLSYATYICHFLVIKIFFSGFLQPVDLSVTFIICYLFGVWICSYIMALLLALFVEIPTTSMIKILLVGKISRAKTSKMISKVL